MPRSDAGRLAATLVAVALAVAACSAGMPPDDPPEVTLIGIVTEILDRVPVDGGVTIRVDVEGRTTETLRFGSLFTMPPPSSERTALYREIQGAKVGSRVRARGVRVDGGIDLTDFRVLE